MTHDGFEEEISFIQEMINKVGAEKMEALHRTAWDIIAQSLSGDEIEKMTQIIKEMRDSGVIVSFRPDIKMVIVDSMPTIVH